ncbi:MAG: peptidoglycan-binding protein, partial [Patescibacteria group bacterium]
LTATVSHLSDFAPLVASGGSAPDTPTGLTPSNPGSGTAINLTWAAVSGASTYNVYKSTDNSSYPLLASPSATSYSATGLTAGTTYYFKVSAVNSTGDESAATTAVSLEPSVVGSGGGGGASGAVAGSTPVITPATPATPATPLSNANSSALNTPSRVSYDLGTTTLKNGSRGEAVKELQRFLNTKLNLGLAIDGSLGPKTIAVIKKWQKDNGLVADGLIGAKTKAMMNAQAAGTPATPATPASSASPNALATPSRTSYDLGTTTLKNGSRGEAVKELQRFLNTKLNLGLAIDGSLGPKTIAVIKKWQKDNGLVADGLIGAKTKAMMNAQVTE